MVAKKRKAAAPRKRAAGAVKKKRRVNTLNRSVKKPMQAAGTAIGAMIPYAGAIVESIKSKSVGPASAALMNKDNAITAGKNAVIGFVAGTVAGTVADKAGLKRPINKIRRTIRGFTGGLI